MSTPTRIIATDFLARSVALSWLSRRRLGAYRAWQYRSLLEMLDRVYARKRFARLIIDPPRKVKKIDFCRLPMDFFLEQISGDTLDLSDLKTKLNRYRERGMRRQPDVSGAVGQPLAPPPVAFRLVCRTADLLTADGLFNPHSGQPYPRSAEEYHALIREIAGPAGIFPGDTGAAYAESYTPDGLPGVQHSRLKRRGQVFRVEIFSPRVHAASVMNRLIFDADLISQIASFNAYGTHGVSYDRRHYYEGRLANCERVPFIWRDGRPVSFAAIQGYEAEIAGQSLFYAFIHFVMTLGDYQGYGLTSYSIREVMSSLFYQNIWRHQPSLVYDRAGQLRDSRWRMWAAAHSGRLATFAAFVRAFGTVDPSWDPIAQVIFRDAHKRITPADDLAIPARAQLTARPIVRINGSRFPVAVDHNVYTKSTRYPHEDGHVGFPQSELNLPAPVVAAWKEAIGGNPGIIDGNALYFGGLVTFSRIQAAKRHDLDREGGGLARRTGEALRRRVVLRTI